MDAVRTGLQELVSEDDMSAILSIPELCEQNKYCVHATTGNAFALPLSMFMDILLSSGTAYGNGYKNGGDFILHTQRAR